MSKTRILLAVAGVVTLALFCVSQTDAGGDLFAGDSAQLETSEPKIYPDGSRGYTSGMQSLWRVNAGTAFTLSVATTRPSDYARVYFVLVDAGTGQVDGISVPVAPRYPKQKTNTIVTRNGCTVKAVAHSGMRTTVVVALETRIDSW